MAARNLDKKVQNAVDQLKAFCRIADAESSLTGVTVRSDNGKDGEATFTIKIEYGGGTYTSSNDSGDDY